MRKSLSFLLSLLLFSVPATAAHVVSKSAHIDITTDKVTIIDGSIDEAAARSYFDQTTAKINLPGPHVVYINSLGGRLDAGDAIISMIDAEKANGVKVICVVNEEATSMAFNILTHCDVRLAHIHSRFLVHKAAYGSWEQGLRMTAKNLRRWANELDRADQPYRNDNCKAMHLTLSEYDDATDTEKTWTSIELLRLGYLQGIVK